MHVMKKGILYAVLASVLWAIVNPFIKQGLSYDFSPMNFAGLRFTVVIYCHISMDFKHNYIYEYFFPIF